MTQIISEFIDAISRQGLTPPSRVVADGKIHRFRSGPEKSHNGFYSLTVLPAHKGGEIGFGLIGCWKRDINEKWCSKEPSKIGHADREAWKRRQEEQRQEAEEATAKAREKAAWIWKNAGKPDPEHPYLKKKQISPLGVREYKGSLVVPVYCGGQITSLQFIGAEGDKRFLSGGQIEGGYASISQKGDGRDTLVICEGFATGASLYAATGFPTIVAFNAGNLPAVAKTIRQKYPDAQIVIAGDNDQLTEIRSQKVNVGVIKATEAAKAVGARVAIPPFPINDPEKASDWNDWACRHGLDSLRETFMTAIADKSPAPEDHSDHEKRSASDKSLPVANPPAQQESDEGIGWQARLVAGKEVAEGHPFPFAKKSKVNAYLFLKHHQSFRGVLRYNEFADQVMLVKQPPWEADGFMPRPIEDDDYFMFSAYLEYCQIEVAKATAADAALRVAKENHFNPPREYLSQLQWDGRPRLDSWLTYYLGVESQPEEYLSMVGSKWLIGAVSRVFSPGCKFDSVLVLEGAQGAGKSMALRALATFNGEDFFLDSVGEIGQKDTLMTMQGKLIVEIAELASFKKSENEEIKAFISRQVDEYRPPYGRTVVKRPRYFVMAGSTNEGDEGYLTDDTGGRRYWPVKCGKIDAEALAVDSYQLWAEAVRRFQSGERTWLTREEAEIALKEQASRLVHDAWEDRIEKLLLGEVTARVDDVMDRLELKPRDINNMTRKRVKNSLRALGWRETRRSSEGRVWRSPAALGFEE